MRAEKKDYLGQQKKKKKQEAFGKIFGSSKATKQLSFGEE